MSFKMAFLGGAVIGVLIAVILWPGFFSNHWTGEWVFLPFRLCPFYLLMFFMRSMAAIVVIAIIGNAVLYGLLAMLGFWFYKLCVATFIFAVKRQ